MLIAYGQRCLLSLVFAYFFLFRFSFTNCGDSRSVIAVHVTNKSLLDEIEPLIIYYKLNTYTILKELHAVKYFNIRF